MHLSTYHEQGLRDYDEDKFIILEKFAGLSHLTLCLVCDGHGGDHASIYLVAEFPKQLLKVFREQKPSEKRKKFVEMLGLALERCIEVWDKHCFGEFHGKITNDRAKKDFFAQRDESHWSENGLESGSTCVALLIDMRKRRAHAINLGDSRATWMVGENATIEQTVDQGVKKDMKPIKGFKFENSDNRLCGDLSMSNSLGDNTLELYGVVSRKYGVKTVAFGEHGFRAVIASDGLFDIASNHSVLYNIFENADAIAKDALQRRQEDVNLVCENAGIDKKEWPKITKFDDNTSIIYVKIPSLQEEKQPRTAEVTGTKEDLQSKLTEAQELLGRFSHLMKDIQPVVVKKPATKKSVEKRNIVPQRKQSLRRNVFTKVEKDGVTVNFVRKSSRERK